MSVGSCAGCSIEVGWATVVATTGSCCDGVCPVNTGFVAGRALSRKYNTAVSMAKQALEL